MEKIIYVPDRLNAINVHKVFNQIQSVVEVNDTIEQLTLDITNLDFVEPAGVVALTALLNYIRFKNVASRYVVKCINREQETLTYLTRMGFFDVTGFDVDYPYSTRDSTGRFCELIQVETEDNIGSAEHKITAMLKRNIGPDAELIASGVGTAVSEVLMNVFHHSGTMIPGYVCAQTYKDGRICIAIVDCGIGFKSHLQRVYSHIETDSDAIKWALKKDITGNADANIRSNTGYGLYGTKELVNKNNGELVIYTGECSYELINGQETYYSVPHWQGSLLSLTFNTDTPVSTQDFYSEIDKEQDIDLDFMFN